MESRPCCSKLVIKASTRAAAVAQKPLATAAVNCKVDGCIRFSGGRHGN